MFIKSACLSGQLTIQERAKQNLFVQCLSRLQVSCTPSLKPSSFRSVTKHTANFNQFLYLPVKYSAKLMITTICDMIKGNESDVGNIDLELQAKRGDKFLCFTMF